MNEKVSRAVGDQRPGSGDDRSASGHARRSVDRPGPSPLTVEQLLARQGVDTGRRRAARRADADRFDDSPLDPGGSGGAPRGSAGSTATPGFRRPAASPRPADVRDGMPPVPGAALPVAAPSVREVAPSRTAGLPPVPAGARSGAASGLPAAAPAERPSAPVPPLPPLPSHPSLPLTDLPYGPVRTSVPVPPLPGTVAPKPKGAGRTRPPKPERSPARKRLVRALVALAAVIGVLVLYGLGLYFYVDRGIDRVDALAVDGPEIIAPELQDASQTYLVVGTDVPGQEGARSITGLLASVSQDGERAVLVSLPPTAMVDTPQCRASDGELREPRTEALAGALLSGGPSCLVRVVQQLSGMQVDHYLELDLARLPELVDALGDVAVCVPSTLAAATADRPLPLGNSTLTSDEVAGWLQPGDQATDYTGALVSQRTQLLLTSTLRSALTAGTLADPVTVTKFLTRASDALTVDRSTTLGDLRELASSLGDLSGSSVQRAELPSSARNYVPAGSETPYVLLDPAQTGSLFESVIQDTRVPGDVLAVQADAEAAASAALQAADAEAAAGAAAEPAPSEEDASPALTVPPADITVEVRNATATAGLAADVGEQLTAEGFGLGDVGNETASVEHTMVRHGAGATEQARTVAAAVPGAELVLNDRIDANAVQLVIGPDFGGVVPVEIPPPAAAQPEGAGGQQPPAPAAPAAPGVSCS